MKEQESNFEKSKIVSGSFKWGVNYERNNFSGRYY